MPKYLLLATAAGLVSACGGLTDLGSRNELAGTAQENGGDATLPVTTNAGAGTNVVTGTGGWQDAGSTGGSGSLAEGGATEPAGSTGGVVNAIDAAPWLSETGGVVSLVAASNCALTPQGVRYTATQQDFEEAIFGDWILCTPQSVFCTSDEVGLEITPDGRWRKLVSNGAGSAVPTQGWGNEGTWEILPNEPGRFQLNLNIDGSGSVITVPILAETPDEVRMDNNGVCIGDYVHAN